MRITLGKKLGFGFGAVLAITLIGALTTLWKLSSMTYLQTRALDLRIPTRAECKDLQKELNQSQSKGRQIILAGAQTERREAAEKLFDSTWNEIDKHIARLDELAPHWVFQENRDRLANIKQHLPGLREKQEAAMRMARRGESADIVKAGDEFADQATTETEAIKHSLDELSAFFSTETDKDVQEIRAENHTVFVTLISTTLLSLAIGIAVAIFLSRRVSITTQAVLAQAEAIASGDLTRDDLRLASKDELGDLTQAINKVNGSLKTMIHGIAENAERVASASAELSATSQQISANSEETSAQANVVSQATQQVSQNLQSVATGAAEMTSTIQSIAANTNEAATVARNAVQTAQTASSTIAKLSDSSSQIGEVIKVITSIAQQTNLLALNATIESARAGEAGKGFAVVANEVKELAKQTAEATEDISRKITTIQTDTKAAVEAIGTITGVINQVSDISGTIATAVEEQSSTTNEMTRNVGNAARGSGEIASNIEGVADAARSASASALESQKAADDLAEMAVRLRVLVEQFKLEDLASSPPSAPIAVKTRGASARA